MRSLSKRNSYQYIFISILLVLAMVFVAGASLFNIEVYQPVYVPTPGLNTSVEDGVVKSVVGDFNGRAVEDGASVMKLFESLKGDFGIKDVDKELHFDKILPTVDGYVFKISQMYDNIPVYGRALSVSTDNAGTILSINSNFKRDAKPRNKKVLTSSGAQVAANAMGKGKALDSQLIIYSLENTTPIYAYMVETDYNFGATLFLDAESGELIQTISGNNDIMLGNTYYKTTAETKAQTNLSDQIVNLDIEKTDGGVYYLADAKRNIVIRDANYKEDYNLESSAYYSNNTGYFADKTAVSALENIIKALDFYNSDANIGKAAFGIDSSLDSIHDNQKDNSEMAITVYVHFGDKLYENAAYIGGGEKGGKNATFIVGDGNPATISNFAGAIDVMGHEYQHAVTAQLTSGASSPNGLIYLNAAGAINESLSDIFCALIGDLELTDENFWLIGEQCMNPSQGKALRDMKDPLSLGDPQVYYGTNFHPFCDKNHNHSTSNCDNGGVHTNSSVINHVAYEMYRLNPTAFTKDFMGQLWYSTVCNLTPNPSFNDLRNIMLQTCKDKAYSQDIQNTIAQAFDNADIYSSETKVAVAFDKQNMTGTPPATIVGAIGSSTFTIPTCDLTQDGFELVGWSVTGDATSIIYRVGVTYDMPSRNITLYPVRAFAAWDNAKLIIPQGDGTIANPYKIGTSQELATFGYYVNNRSLIENIPIKTTDVYCELTADIDLKSVPWIPIGIDGSYENTNNDGHLAINFDGKKHRIYNYVASRYIANYGGVFGRIDGAIANLGVDGGASTVNVQYYGAIVGRINGSITNCYNTTTVTNNKGNSFTAGIVGCVDEYSLVTNCYNRGGVTGAGTGATSSNVVGGIVATNKVTALYSEYTNYDTSLQNRDSRMFSYPAIGNVYNSGALKGDIVGGIGGMLDGVSVANAINTGKITSAKIGGGIVGGVNLTNFESLMSSVFAKRLVVVTQIFSCKNTGVISATGLGGGIVGKMFGDMNMGCVQFYNNTFKRQAMVNDIGNYSNFTTEQTKMFQGSRAVASGDAAYSGAFDFDSAAFYADRSNWSIMGWTGLFAPQIWKFKQLNMPSFGVLGSATDPITDSWTAHKAANYDGGNGSELAPYLINTAEQLALLAFNVNSGIENGKHYRLTANIDLGAYIWEPIGKAIIDGVGYSAKHFSGSFDGDNHIISNLFATGGADSDCVGLFGSVGYNTADNYVNEIKNIALENVNAVGSITGGIIGHVDGSVRISGCDILSGNVSGTLLAGGIVGDFNYDSDPQDIASVKRCSNNAIVASSGYAGGIVGDIETKCAVLISDCVNKMDIIAYQDDGVLETAVGGIVGRVSSEKLTIERCVTHSKLTNYSFYGMTGGIVGSFIRDNLEINNCVVKGDIAIQSSQSLPYPPSVTATQNTYAGAIIGGTCVYNDPNQAAKLGKVTLRDCYYNINGGIGNMPEISNSKDVSRGNQVVLSYAKQNVNASVSAADFDFTSQDYYKNTFYFGAIDNSKASYLYARMNDKLIVELLINYEQYAVTYFDGLGDYSMPVTDPSSEKYTFLHWTDTSGKLIDKNAPIKINKDTKIIAAVEWIIVPATFKNFDGTIIAEADVINGEIPIFTGANPIRESTAQYDYVFSGWDKPLVNITSPTIYTAQYTSKIRQYTITFDNNGTITTQTCDYGSVVELHEPTTKYGRYLGWVDTDKNIYRESVTIERDITLTAKWIVGEISAEELKGKIDAIVVDSAAAFNEISVLSKILNADEYITYTASRELLATKIAEYNAYAAAFPNGVETIKNVESNLFGIASAAAASALSLSCVGVYLLMRRRIL